MEILVGDEAPDIEKARVRPIRRPKIGGLCPLSQCGRDTVASDYAGSLEQVQSQARTGTVPRAVGGFLVPRTKRPRFSTQNRGTLVRTVLPRSVRRRSGGAKCASNSQPRLEQCSSCLRGKKIARMWTELGTDGLPHAMSECGRRGPLARAR